MRTLDQLRATLLQLEGNPGEAVRGASDLSDYVASLAPPAMGIASRPHFERATEYTFPMVFENVQADVIVGPKPIVASFGDVWVRGMTASCYPAVVMEDPEDFANVAARLNQFRFDLGPEWRALFDLEYSIDGKHGYIQDGFSDVMADGRELTGDGQQLVPLDWTLQRDQVLQVKLRSKLRELGMMGRDNPIFSALRYVVITFWAKDLSSRGR